jgi:hypothetical protein
MLLLFLRIIYVNIESFKTKINKQFDYYKMKLRIVLNVFYLIKLACNNVNFKALSVNHNT